MTDTITIKGARLHNLKNLTLSIPKNALVVFTGLSGSGKSTLAFDTLHKEGQRQYMESLGLVTDNLTKPPMDGIEGLSPSIAVDQHLTNRSPRSTVGTATEVFTYLRVLFARLGRRPCPGCGAEIPPSHDVGSVEVWDEENAGGGSAGSPYEGAAEETYPCPECGAPVPEIGMAHFSFNTPAGACPTCTGLGRVLEADVTRLMDREKSIASGAVFAWDEFLLKRYSDALAAAGRHFGFDFDVKLPVKKLGKAQYDLLLHGAGSPRFRSHFPDIAPPKTVPKGNFEGIVTNLMRRYKDRGASAEYREKLEKRMFRRPCPDCEGVRLKAESRQVTVQGKNIMEASRMSLEELAEWLGGLRASVPEREWAIAEPVTADLSGRIQRLVDVGVGYLTMERSSPTLSGGEAQRLRLAALLGSGLTGVLYVLDEPTIGLHPRDTARLIRTLKRLRDLGNTVLVIEHDLELLRAADHVVDIGPGAGRSGGRVVAAGSPSAIAACRESATGGHLSGRLAIPVPSGRRKGNGSRLVIRGARENNLKNVTVSIPLGTFVAVTGVSGSGKSSLILDVLDKAAQNRYSGGHEMQGACDGIEGWEHLEEVRTIDQSAIGRTPRSNAATYTDAFTPIREAFAETADARAAGLSARDFSFNVPGGRCERCRGAGVLSVEMHFLPDVQVRCPACRGRRFTKKALSVPFKGQDISRILELTVEEALPLFQEVPAAASRLSVLSDVGLGYLQLGQPATTLSGGEAQRIKLSKELGRRAAGSTLYLLDEPTTGLHPADTARLLGVLQRLVEAGNTVAVIEHNLDVIKTADWVIDLGPEGGEAGGRVVAEGTPERVAGTPASLTGRYLRPLLGGG
jgi:excinuclease ABC subunit A